MSEMTPEGLRAFVSMQPALAPYITAWEGDIAKREALEKAGMALVEYRKRVGAGGFQLEKMDDYIRRLAAIAQEKKPRVR